MIKAYIMRHGSTTISPSPEGWLQVPLDGKGMTEASLGAKFLRRLIEGGCPRPDWGISSDLKRAEQTLQIASRELGIRVVQPLFNLRAYDKDHETPAQYEARNVVAFEDILNRARVSKSIPLVTCHRSSTAFLAMKHGLIKKSPDYRQFALLMEGGLMEITDAGLRPLFRVIEENWNAS